MPARHGLLGPLWTRISRSRGLLTAFAAGLASCRTVSTDSYSALEWIGARHYIAIDADRRQHVDL